MADPTPTLYGKRLLNTGVVVTADLADDAVTAAKMADDAVTGDTIAALGVNAGKLNLGAVSNSLNITAGIVAPYHQATATVTVAASRDILATDIDDLLACTGSRTLTTDDSIATTGAAGWRLGQSCVILNADAGTTTVAAGVGETLTAPNGATLVGAGATGVLTRVGTSSWLFVAQLGDMDLLGIVAAPGGAAGTPLTVTSGMLPAGFEAIRLECRLRGDRASTSDQLWIRFNGDNAGTNYDRHLITNAAVVFNSATTGTIIGDMSAATSVADVYGRTSIVLPNYDSAVEPKQAHGVSMVAMSRAAMQQRTAIIAWYQAAAITQIQLIPATGNILAGEVLVYGVRRGSTVW